MNQVVRRFGNGELESSLRHSVQLIPVLFALNLTACSSQQLYGAGQEWQKNECNKIIDTQERTRCMSSAKTAYEDYKRQSEAAKGTAK
jgi:hypothetical protein